MLRTGLFQTATKVTITAAAIVFVAAAVSHAERTRIVLRDNWHIKQLDNDQPDVAELTRQAAKPDKTWMAARMPEQVHDVL